MATSALKVKAAVRERAGNCCEKCGMTNDEHKRRHLGDSLHVHRKQPGTPYSMGGAELLCRGCHTKAHRLLPPVNLRRDALPSAPKMVLYAIRGDAEAELPLRIQAGRAGLSLSSYCRLALELLAAGLTVSPEMLRAEAKKRKGAGGD
jgi:hypothetical protein